MIFVQKRSSRETLPIVRLAVEFCLGSFATDAAGPACHLMSALTPLKAA
jgi:hypothetical protein